MKTNITVIGLTEPMEDLYEYLFHPVIRRQVKYVENPMSHKIFYASVRPPISYAADYFSQNKFSTYESHELIKLIYYED